MVFFSSWENDLDNCQTLIQTGFTETDLALSLGIIREFKEVSNSFENSEDMIYLTVKRELDAVLQRMGPDNAGEFTNDIREILRDGLSEPDVTLAGWLHEVLTDTIYGQPGDSYYYNASYFLRKIESVHVAAMHDGMSFPVELKSVYSRFN
jgi:hypothetical protein